MIIYKRLIKIFDTAISFLTLSYQLSNIFIMVIQRWQSVFLLLSAVLMGTFTLAPFAQVSIDNTVHCISSLNSSIPYLVLNILISILTLISIFLYKNLKQQKSITLITILLTIASIISGILLVKSIGSDVIWHWTCCLPILSIILLFMAHSRMRADERLLKSYDRIR